MKKELEKYKIIKILKDRNIDLYKRSINHIVTQNDKIIKLKNSIIEFDKNYKYIPPKSYKNHNLKFWNGFFSFRHILFKN